jgi:PBSX family phage terminase large subunit
MNPASPAAGGFRLSDKQVAFIEAEDKRLNFLEGAIRSGKTVGSLWKWGALFVPSLPEDYEFLMAGKTITSLRRNCLAPLQRYVGRRNFEYSLSLKEGRLFGRRIWLEGANDERSEGKIQGMTLGGAYCDEFTLFPESFVSMLLGRLSLPGAKLFATMNPAYPKHYVKTRYIDNGSLDRAVWKFTLDDNIFLPEDYKRNLKKEYAGTVFYKRYIDGEWCQAEGVVYPTAASKPDALVIKAPPAGDISHAIIGVDFGGNKSADAFVAMGIGKQGRVYAVDEEQVGGIKTPAELERRFIAFVRRVMAKYKVYEGFVDSAEQTLKAGLEAALTRERIPIALRNAKKGPIVDRIRLTNALISKGKFKVLPNCPILLEAFRGAVWNEKKAKDERLDDGKTSNIDILDAMEYALEDIAEMLILEAEKEPKI